MVMRKVRHHSIHSRMIARRGFLATTMALPVVCLAQCADDQTIEDVAEKVDAGLHEGMERWKVPSASYAIFGCNKVRIARAHGVARGGIKRAPDIRTLYQAASISKTVTAVTALRLVQEGRLKLDEDVSVRLKSWKLPPGPQDSSAPVTLRRLFGMTAGVNVHGFPGYAADTKQPTLVEILNGMKPIVNTEPIRVVKRPGGQQEYSGGGYEIAELVMQDVTGEKLASLAKRSVFDPLQMRDSYFAHPLPHHVQGQAADGHNSAGVPLSGRWHNYPEGAAAGLWTTPTDLARIALAVSESWQRGGFLEQKIAQEMMTHVDGFGYGIGGAVGGAGDDIVFNKGGDNAGYHCSLIFFPRTGQGMAIMTNGDQGPRLFDRANQAASAGLHWPPFPRIMGG